LTAAEYPNYAIKLFFSRDRYFGLSAHSARGIEKRV